MDAHNSILVDLWCLRCLLLVMCTYLFVKKALTLHLARGEGRERYFGCNLMQRNVLASSHQHLMAEAPYDDGWLGLTTVLSDELRSVHYRSEPSVPMMMRHLAWQKLDSKEGEKVA